MVDMKAHSALMYVVVLFALADAQAVVCRTESTASDARQRSALAAELFEPTPAALHTVGTPLERHLFPVTDDRGLLLSCVAPELGTNSDTDVFENCALAPGRTLDDVMHSLVKAIHSERHEVEQHEGVTDDNRPNQGATVSAEQKNAQN
jgi:hypothetical protein